MAVIFISPKQRQKMFFMGITVAFLLFLTVVFLVVFLSEPTKGSLVIVFNKPKVNIDMTIFDSQQFKDLQPPVEIQTLYSYTAMDQGGLPKAGFVTAASQDDAEQIILGMGLISPKIKIVESGRDNPFTPYYTPAVKVVIPKIKAK